MIKDETKIKEDTRGIRWKSIIGFSTVFLIALVFVLLEVKDHADKVRLDAVYEKQMEMKSDFKENMLSKRKRSMTQDSAIPGILLLNVGDADAKDFDNSEIHNIFIVVFEKKATYGRVNIVGLQKKIIVKRGEGGNYVTIQDAFDKDDPQKMYDAIEKATDYRIGGYIVYNNDIVKQIVDQNTFLKSNVIYSETYSINDVPLLNKGIEQYALKYGIADITYIEQPGVQPLNTIQMLAYVNLYYDDWNCMFSDWRHLNFLYYTMDDLKRNNMENLKKIGQVLLKGRHSLTEEQCVIIGAAIREYRIGSINRWPQKSKSIIYNGKEYRIPDDLLECADILHKEKHGEKKYKQSDKMKSYQQELNKIEQDILMFTESY